MSSGAVGPSGRPDVLWRLRWWMLSSGVVVLAALVVLEAVVVRQSIHVGLLVWGVVLGALTATGVWVVGTRLLHRGDLGADRQEWVRHRRAVYAVTWSMAGAVVGLVAAIFGLTWLLFAFAGYVVLIAGVVAAVLLVVRRRRVRG